MSQERPGIKVGALEASGHSMVHVGDSHQNSSHHQVVERDVNGNITNFYQVNNYYYGMRPSDSLDSSCKVDPEVSNIETRAYALPQVSGEGRERKPFPGSSRSTEEQGAVTTETFAMNAVVPTGAAPRFSAVQASETISHATAHSTQPTEAGPCRRTPGEVEGAMRSKCNSTSQSPQFSPFWRILASQEASRPDRGPPPRLPGPSSRTSEYPASSPWVQPQDLAVTHTARSTSDALPYPASRRTDESDTLSANQAEIYESTRMQQTDPWIKRKPGLKLDAVSWTPEDVKRTLAQLATGGIVTSHTHYAERDVSTILDCRRRPHDLYEALRSSGFGSDDAAKIASAADRLAAPFTIRFCFNLGDSSRGG